MAWKERVDRTASIEHIWTTLNKFSRVLHTPDLVAKAETIEHEIIMKAATEDAYRRHITRWSERLEQKVAKSQETKNRVLQQCNRLLSWYQSKRNRDGRLVTWDHEMDQMKNLIARVGVESHVSKLYEQMRTLYIKYQKIYAQLKTQQLKNQQPKIQQPKTKQQYPPPSVKAQFQHPRPATSSTVHNPVTIPPYTPPNALHAQTQKSVYAPIENPARRRYPAPAAPVPPFPNQIRSSQYPAPAPVPGSAQTQNPFPQQYTTPAPVAPVPGTVQPQKPYPQPTNSRVAQKLPSMPRAFQNIPQQRPTHTQNRLAAPQPGPVSFTPANAPVLLSQKHPSSTNVRQRTYRPQTGPVPTDVQAPPFPYNSPAPGPSVPITTPVRPPHKRPSGPEPSEDAVKNKKMKLDKPQEEEEEEEEVEISEQVDIANKKLAQLFSSMIQDPEWRKETAKFSTVNNENDVGFMVVS